MDHTFALLVTASVSAFMAYRYGLRASRQERTVLIRVRPHTPKTLAGLGRSHNPSPLVSEGQFARNNLPNSGSRFE